MKGVCLLFRLVVTVGVETFMAFAGNQTKAAGYPEFIVSYWGGPPAAESTEARYRQIADCGFNVAMPPADDSDLKTNLRILDACKAVGLKAIIADKRMPLTAKSPELERTLDAIVADYSNHPALAGYFVADEPNSTLFPILGRINQYLLTRDPERLPFVNLFPNYANTGQFGNKNYQEHVSQFIATVKPALVSWDHYRQMEGDERLYFSNLEIVRQQCQKANLPFIQIILSLPHWNYRNPNEADLRWQVYTSLAYGARGVMYFTYWVDPAWRLGNGPAIMRVDGKPDVKYEWVQRLNGRLKALGPTLVQLKSTGVYATAPLLRGLQGLTAEAPVKQAEGGAMLFGCFKGRLEEPYVMVVNRSFKDRITAKLTMADRVLAMAEISQESGKPLERKGLKNNVMETSLEAGEGKLFLLSQP